MNIEENLSQARLARMNGDWRSADLFCRAVLEKDPLHPVAAGLLGQILAEHGNLGAAKHFIELAVGLAPNNADVRVNSAVFNERQGDLKKALDDCVRATELDPTKFEVWATFGNFLGKAGLFEQAAKALKHAVRLNPKHPGAALLLAGACFELGDFAGVNEALAIADRAAPDLPQTLKLRTHAARRAGDDETLIAAADRWLEKEPESDEARIAFAFGLAQAGHFARAAEMLQPLADREPPTADYLATMGRYHLGARDLDAAKAWFERALAADPDFVDAHYGLGRTATYVGDLETAQAHCRRAIEIDKGHIDALALLTEICEGRIGDSEFESLKALAANPLVRPEARATADYAYGDACHKRRQHAEAFAAWTRANEHKTAILRASPAGAYDPLKQERKALLLKEVFARDPLGARFSEEAASYQVPIFIVGMPRSGTTLLETAISAHSMVAGGGEVPALPYLLDEVLAVYERPESRGRRLDDKTREAARELYFRQVRELGVEERAFLTDKQPSNFLSVGLIRVLFPQARIIHIRRKPLETGMSIYRRNFSKQWPFAFDQEAIAHYYVQYARMMNHWRRHYPDAVAFVQYEDLVENFESELRRIIDWCGLPWEDGCVNYQTAERSVITFSAVQVRKGASKSHIGGADPYREFLKPMADALIAAGVDLETGELAHSAS